MSARIRALKAKKADAHKQASALLDKSAAEGRDLTADEKTAFDGYKADMLAADQAIEREEFMANQAAGLGGVEIPASATLTVVENRAADPRRGFRSFGEFARAVQAASSGGVRPDERLTIGAAAPSTYGGEGAGADGGYAVPPQFATEIQTYALAEDAMLPLTDNTPVTGNSMVFPKDETTPWGTDGIRAYWQAEAAAGSATKPKLGTTTLRLHKLMALVPLTDELIADTNALDGYLPAKVGASIRWKTNEAIFAGNGAGQPQGIMNSGALVSITKESGQAASTVDIKNIAKMVAALLPGSFARATWFVTPDALPALFTLTLGNYPIYLPTGGSVGGAQNSPYGTLMGRPIMISQHAAAFSSAGDIQLHDMSWYRTITKAGGPETATSMHLYFDADATAFRTTFRVDGQSKIAAAVSQAKGSQSLSPFVALGAR